MNLRSGPVLSKSLSPTHDADTSPRFHFISPFIEAAKPSIEALRMVCRQPDPILALLCYQGRRGNPDVPHSSWCPKAPLSIEGGGVASWPYNKHLSQTDTRSFPHGLLSLSATVSNLQLLVTFDLTWQSCQHKPLRQAVPINAFGHGGASPVWWNTTPRPTPKRA
ncbi:hypothetical protein CGRA01v4_07271 [Colletotrichum graminicola]|nr:hypothetical protein CGRA01v4_07271 [Colletotrichum graminicola]